MSSTVNHPEIKVAEVQKDKEELIMKEAQNLQKQLISFNNVLFYMNDNGVITKCQYHRLTKKDDNNFELSTSPIENAYKHSVNDDYKSTLFDRVFIPAENKNGIFSVTKLVDMATHDEITQILANINDERSFIGTDFILNGVRFTQTQQDYFLLE